MDTDDMMMKIAQIQNILRDMNNSIHSIQERNEMSSYINPDREYYPVGIGNSTFLCTSDEITPLLNAVKLRDAVAVTNFNSALDRALEELKYGTS